MQCQELEFKSARCRANTWTPVLSLHPHEKTYFKHIDEVFLLICVFFMGSFPFVNFAFLLWWKWPLIWKSMILCSRETCYKSAGPSVGHPPPFWLWNLPLISQHVLLFSLYKPIHVQWRKMNFTLALESRFKQQNHDCMNAYWHQNKISEIIWSFKQSTPPPWDQIDSTPDRALPCMQANPGSIPGIPYCPCDCQK